MKHVLKHEVSKEHYQSDACIVWCFDNRFSELLDVFTRQEKFRDTDVVEIAGGIKDIANPSRQDEREYVLGQIEKSVRLHKTPLIVLMAHNNCGAYGGTEDVAFYEQELRKAKKLVEEHLAQRNMQARVSAYFADFDGLHELV